MWSSQVNSNQLAWSISYNLATLKTLHLFYALTFTHFVAFFWVKSYNSVEEASVYTTPSP